MLREIRNVRQIPGELRRRWFASDTMDLIVWLDESDDPAQLQLCYDKGRLRTERALTWKLASGYTHTAVDDGEAEDIHYKSTPILVADGNFDSTRVGELFLQGSARLPPDIIQFVATKIQEYQTGGSHFPYPGKGSATTHPHEKPG